MGWWKKFREEMTRVPIGNWYTIITNNGEETHVWATSMTTDTVDMGNRADVVVCFWDGDKEAGRFYNPAGWKVGSSVYNPG